MEKVLFIYPKSASFIKLDLQILSERYEVIENTYSWHRKNLLPFILIRQFIFLITTLPKSDHVIISFGGWWGWLPALLAKGFNKPSYIIIHGTDATSFPELNYGNIRKPWLKYILRQQYQNTTSLLPVSESLIYTENTYYDQSRIIKQGLDYFFPNISTQKIVIPNAIDGNKWVDFNKTRKQNLFITVFSPGQFTLKGGDLLLNIAPLLPHFKFKIIGHEKPYNLKSTPKNIEFIGRSSPEQLVTYYNEAKFYLQLSISEGFGVALCEAMACGCIPIVSNVNALPNIIGNSGFILKHRNTNELVDLINIAFTESNEEMRHIARQRILNEFSIEKRKDLLFNTISINSIIKIKEISS